MKRPLGRSKIETEDVIKMEMKTVACNCGKCFGTEQDRTGRRAFEERLMNFCVV